MTTAAAPDLSLDGETVLVTGASRGLGRAIGDSLHALGARVVGTSRAESSIEEIGSRWGVPGLALDVTRPAEVASAIDALFASGRRPSILINNAGVNRPQAAVEVDLESWDVVQNSNLRGVFFVIQAVGKHWIADGIRGSIVNVGSQAGRVAIEDRVAYGSSKAGLEQLTRNLAFEWGRHGIRVNAVAPTFVMTDLTASTLSRSGFSEQLLSRIPLGRFAQPQDVAYAVAFLAGHASEMITGHTLVIDGGYTIH